MDYVAGKKILLLVEVSKDDWAYIGWKNSEVDVEIIFKKVNKVLRAIRRIWIRFGLPFKEIWYSKHWLDKAKAADVIIVYVSNLNLSICRYLNIVNLNAKIIAWYWNIVDEGSLPEKIKGDCEKWTFDPGDAKKYNMRLNHQYYFKSWVVPSKEIYWDVYFCGSDCGRGKKIAEIYHICRNIGLTVLFQVVYSKCKLLPVEIMSEKVQYKQICQNIASSKAILEILRNGQSGPTIRMMESLFFQKKLITDNQYVKQEEFYDERNIFLIGDRPISELKLFLDGEFVPYDEELLNKYDVKQWMNNFFIEKSK